MAPLACPCVCSAIIFFKDAHCIRQYLSEVLRLYDYGLMTDMDFYHICTGWRHWSVLAGVGLTMFSKTL